MKPLKVHPQAKSELQEAVDWYERQRSGVGMELNDIVETVFQQIESSPQLGWRYGNLGYRVLPAGKFPYFVYYIEHDDCIFVPAISHQSREPDYWQSRQPV